ncbi:hypothetical protein EAG_08504 [Camponotus floridanus]|uniref:Uncharacterized protein n=1 Tax=Camponotus floridanus TaxID=104421 RepID=E2AKP2_CAMFO|nr:hypothetical protein EAG_08504 [Camponotus floridanus]
MPNIPAVAEPKVTNVFHTREAVFSTILLSEASSSRLYIDIACISVDGMAADLALSISRTELSWVAVAAELIACLAHQV